MEKIVFINEFVIVEYYFIRYTSLKEVYVYE
jgi:hypothetical protein